MPQQVNCFVGFPAFLQFVHIDACPATLRGETECTGIKVRHFDKDLVIVCDSGNGLVARIRRRSHGGGSFTGDKDVFSLVSDLGIQVEKASKGRRSDI